jgi:speckle-type POZ protein
MEHGRTTNLTEAVRSVQLLKIDGYCATAAMSNSDFIKSIWNVDGHEWEVHLYPRHNDYVDYWVAVRLVLRSQPQKKTWANLTCRLVDPSRNLDPSEGWSLSYEFEKPRECNCVPLVKRVDSRKKKEFRNDLPSSGYLVNDSVTVECTITVLRHLPADGIVIPADREVPLPSSDLQRHLGDLLQGQRGADVTFVLDSGERFPAHKPILAARSPVFMAEFFGDMNERRSQSIRIQDMQAAVFKAMLHFIYTDKAPELEEDPEAPPVAAMAQHLLAAADR